MTCSLFQLKPLKASGRGASSTALLLVLPALLTTFIPLPVHAQPKPALVLGIVDEEKLAQSRSDFPLLAAKVLPQVAAKRHLTLVVTRRGLRWGQSKVPSVDITPDIVALLQNEPLTPGALTGEQQKAARTALDTLSALDVALRVGNLTYQPYNDRLTNTSVAVDASLKKVPDGALKVQLAQTMQAFLNVRGAWDTNFEAIKQGDKAIEANQQGIRALLGQTYYAQHQAEYDKEAEAKREQVRREAARPVVAAQEKAAREVEAAEKLLSALFTK